MSACFNGLCRVVTFSLLLLLLLAFSFFSVSSACSNGTCQMLDSCSLDSDCVPGLYCGDCAAARRTKPICIRGQATIPTSIINGLPFNKYTWLMTHNSFSYTNAPPLPGVERVTLYNQEDTITNQLRNGVRGLMLDMYDFNNDIWLCHSLRGQCFNFTAFEPAINTLKEIETFMSQNPTEIVTIIIEDYVQRHCQRPKGLSTLFAKAVSRMPKRGEDWPTVTAMVKENHRLLVFTSVAAKEDEESIAYQWRYLVENESGDPGVKRGSCPNRKESRPLDSNSSSLFLMNYFPTIAVEKEACKDNSAPLSDMVGTCLKSAGNRTPNFLAVKTGAAFGSCKNVTPKTDSTSGSYSCSVQLSRTLASLVFCFSWFQLLMFLL